MIAVLILAAGKGTRMNSELPKVLHQINGRTLIEYVLSCARRLEPDRLIVIVGHKRNEVAAAAVAADGKIEFVTQEPQLGTGHAVMQAKSVLNDFVGDVVVLSGDVPLLRGATLKRLVREHRLLNAAATVLSTKAQDPAGYGRIVRDKTGVFLRIAEDRDATSEEKLINEINSGIYCFRWSDLARILGELGSANSKNEYYLTDAVQILRDQGAVVQAVEIAEFSEVCGINTASELKSAEAALHARNRAS
jgi:UDP-N-acetylglucosamine diphosphorylase/glucosamine-1-phosphate N-acetyltransferase